MRIFAAGLRRIRSITSDAIASISKDRDGGPVGFGVSQADSGDCAAVNTSTSCIDRFVRPPEVLDLFDGVENRRVVAAVIKSADLRQAPAAHALR
jgi:hypothetical protein